MRFEHIDIGRGHVVMRYPPNDVPLDKVHRAFRNEGIAVAPVVAVAGEEAHALALALDDQAVAVVPDFVKPVRAGGHSGPSGRNARLIQRFEHAAKIGETAKIAN